MKLLRYGNRVDVKSVALKQYLALDEGAHMRNIIMYLIPIFET